MELEHLHFRFFMYMSILLACIYVPEKVRNGVRFLELQAVVTCLIWVLGFELRSTCLYPSALFQSLKRF